VKIVSPELRTGLRSAMAGSDSGTEPAAEPGVFRAAGDGILLWTNVMVPLVARTAEPIPTSHPHIVMGEGICGDRPHIRGSRVSVRTIAELFRQGEPASEIAAAYRHVPPAAIYNAISYYLDHQAGIEAEIEANSLETAMARTNAELGDDGVIHFRGAPG
jgi:uncharacterized protein (DUF433 family)